MVAAGTQLPNLPREDRHRLTLFFQHEENLATLADHLNRPPSSPTGGGAGAAGGGGSVPTPSTQPPSHDNHTIESNGSLSPSSPPSSPHTIPSDPALDEFELQSWATRPDIAAHIDFRRQQADHRRRQSTLAALEEVLKQTKDLIEKRRVATAILRTLNRAGPSSPTGGGGRAAAAGGSVSTLSTEPPCATAPPSRNHPAPGDQADDTDDDDPYPDHTSPSFSPHCPLPTPHCPSPLPSIPAAFTNPTDSPPTPLPDPTRTPQDLIHLTIQAIQNPNQPERNTGPFTLWNLKGSIKGRAPADFAEFRGNYLANMIRGAWEFTSHSQRWLKLRPPPPESHIVCSRDHLAYALIDLTLRDQSRRILHIELRKETNGILKDCWLLKHFFIATTQHKSPYPGDPFNDTS